MTISAQHRKVRRHIISHHYPLLQRRDRLEVMGFNKALADDAIFQKVDIPDRLRPEAVGVAETENSLRSGNREISLALVISKRLSLSLRSVVEVCEKGPAIEPSLSCSLALIYSATTNA